MKLLREKTQAEKDGEATEALMTVRAFMQSDGRRELSSWYCENCGILYEPDDIIVVRKHKGTMEPLCPRKGRLGFSCKTRLLTGWDDYWEKNYHISDFPEKSSL